MKKKVVDWVIILTGIVLAISFSRDIIRLLKSDDRIGEAVLKVEELEEENRRLKEQEEFFASEEFVEEQARNRLNMSREGETVVLLPPNVSELVNGAVPTPAPELPNWKKWCQLFLDCTPLVWNR